MDVIVVVLLLLILLPNGALPPPTAVVIPVVTTLGELPNCRTLVDIPNDGGAPKPEDAEEDGPLVVVLPKPLLLPPNEAPPPNVPW